MYRTMAQVERDLYGKDLMNDDWRALVGSLGLSRIVTLRSYRLGQALFNAVPAYMTETITASEADCFYNDRRIGAFIDALYEVFKGGVELDWQYWEATFSPITNHFDENAAYDGCLFETYGQEVAFVAEQAPGTVWTLLDTDEGLVLNSGFHLVNRIGYIVTERPALCDITVTDN